jgi:hypothetical protein
MARIYGAILQELRPDSGVAFATHAPFVLKGCPVKPEVIFVFFSVSSPLVWNVHFRENRRHWASWYTCTAINTLVGVYEELHFTLVFALNGMNALNWADIHAGTVFDANTGFANDMWHGSLLEDQYLEVCALPVNYSSSDR